MTDEMVTLPDGSMWDGDKCLTEGGATLSELNDRAHGTPDPRDPDPTRAGIFRLHNCWKCRSGEVACANGNPSRCEYPHARND